MRELKFRAWDERLKKMLYGDNGDFDGIDEDGIIILEHEDDGDRITERWITKDMELMQFTGFKDKNGKEIYEGDIFEKNGLIQHVHWNRLNASFYLQPRHLTKNFDDKIGRYGFDEIELFKIIGNIYENKELMK